MIQSKLKLGIAFTGFTAAVLFSGMSTAAKAAQWVLTPQSQISFDIKSLGLSVVRGQFQRYQSSMKFDAAAPQNTQVSLVLDSESLTFSNNALKGMITGKDFFYIEQYKTVKFSSTEVLPQGPNRYRVKGILNLRGAAQPAVFDTQLIPNERDPKIMEVDAKAVIERTDFGMKKSLGGVGEKVNIELKGLWKIQ